MCGLVGAFGPSAERVSVNLDAALQSIHHRGPDASGKWRSPNCILGHRRLSILDLSNRSDQPMVRDGDALIYNGEIYNHAQMRSDGLFPYSFSTESDTETLLNILRFQGLEALARCEGMFAGAFWKESERALFLFRDALGIKPLYYHIASDSTVLFASEIKAILTLDPAIERQIHWTSLKSYFRYENFGPAQTLFRNIRLVMPGSVLKLNFETLGSNRVTVQEKLNFGMSTPSSAVARYTGTYEDCVKETSIQIETAVRSHLLSDVPVGVYMSGGIDSSLVATLAARNQRKMMAFTGYFETQEPFYDERPLTRKAAKEAGISLVEVPIGPENLLSNFDSLIYSLDEPRMGMGSFSQMVVAHEAAKNCKVVLAGHGGDELFAGYPQFKAFQLLELKKIFSLLSVRGKEWPWILDQLWGYFRTGKVHFAPELYPPPRSLHCVPDKIDEFEKFPDEAPLQQLMNYYQRVYLPGLLLVEDKVSMQSGIETRTPLWSQSLVSWASSIPLSFKIRDGRLKGILRDVARTILPSELLNAPKRGFPTPLRIWFRGPLYGFLTDRLLVPGNRLHRIVAPSEIKKLLESHRRMVLPFALDERRAHRIWILLCLESWIRQFNLDVSEGL